MKKMTCLQLGGACDKVFEANSFEEIAELSKQHGTEMFKAGDAPHLEAMNKMRALMHEPEKMRQWFADKKLEFENLPDS